MAIARDAIRIRFIDYLMISLVLLSLVSGGFSLLRVTGVQLDRERPADLNDQLNTINSSPLLQPTYWFSALLLVCFVFYSKRMPHLDPVKSWIKGLGIFIAYMILSTFWAANPSLSQMTIPQLINILFLVVVSYAIFGSLTDIKIDAFFRLLFIVSLIYILWAMFELGTTSRISVPYGGPNIFVRYMSGGFFISIYFWMTYRTKIWLVFLPLFLLFAVWSGSRGGVAALIISFLFFVLYILIPKKRFISFFVSILLVIAFFYNLLPLSELNITKRVEETWSKRFVKLTFEQRYTSRRDRIYQGAWQTFLANPVHGVGLSNLALYTESGGYAHNIILDVASEGGAAGLLMFGWVFLLIFRGAHRVNSLIGRFSLVLGIYYFSASMFSGTYYDTRFMWIFFLFYLLTLAQEDGDRPAIDKSRDLTGSHKCIFY